MKLKSFGCSFIFGTDLPSPRSLHNLDLSVTYLKPSELTWPALLAEKHKWDYSCHARPGAGNLEIAERVLSQLADPEPAVYVIGWTWIDRFNYTADYNSYWDSNWRSVTPTDSDLAANTYYRHFHSELRDKLTTLINVRVVIDALKASGNPFVMTYIDDLMFDQQWNTTPAIMSLQNYCQPFMTQFENKSFLEYSKEKGFEFSPTLHPLKDAHQSAFELIDSYNLV